MQSVPIGDRQHKVLKDLSAQTDRPMADLLSEAIEDLRRKFILEATNEAYRVLREDQQAWADEMAERELWDNATVADADLEKWT